MLLRLNQVVFGLGRGVLGASSNRMGVWTQGCSLRKCPGCSSTHIWSPTAGKVVSAEALLKLAHAQSLPPSGLTVSGGEPTDQAEGITGLIARFRETFPGSEIVLYTGLRWSVLAKRFPALVAQLDVAVTGPFVRTREATPLTGSSNQEVHLLTPLAERLYYDWQDWSRHALQIGYTKAEQLVAVGIPHTPRMARAALQVGAIDVTWDSINEGKHV
jgi:hypothetical protein